MGERGSDAKYDRDQRDFVPFCSIQESHCIEADDMSIDAGKQSRPLCVWKVLFLPQHSHLCLLLNMGRSVPQGLTIFGSCFNTEVWMAKDTLS